MKLLIYGAGVIGSIFAGKLSLAGNDVTVLARNKRYDDIDAEGILLSSPHSKKVDKATVTVINELLADDRYDYIIVAVQRTQVDNIFPILSRNCSPNIVLVVNTAGGYDTWASMVGENRLILGFPSAGGERKDGRIIYFVGKGFQRVFQTTTFGEYSGEKTGRVQTLIDLFNQAGIPSVFCKDMDAWQKTHVAMVTNIANALYGYHCDNYTFGRSYRAVRDMVLGIKEGRRVLRYCGIKPTPKKLWWLGLPTPVLGISFALFMRTKLAETTMAKHCAVAKNEMVVLQQEFDVLIGKSGIATPVIDRLKKNLYFKHL